MKKIMAYIRNLLTRPQTEVEEKPPVKPDASGLDANYPFETFKKELDSLDDVGVKMGLQKRICASQEYMYESGRRDGSLGVRQKESIADIARSTARELFHDLFRVIRGRKAGLNAEMETRRETKAKDQETHQQEHAYFNFAQYQYRFFPRSHSWFLFVMYFIIGLALIMADIPLALKLIQSGYNFETTGGEEHQISNLMNGPTWTIVKANWETFTTALGIALCTIYIKIFYDDYIGTPYAGKYMSREQFHRVSGKVSGEFSDEIRQEILREQRGKLIWKTSIFLITMVVIIALALFRLKTMSADTKSGFEVNLISGTAFVGITLIFPVVGGVCLSLSFNNFQNLWRLRVARKNSDTTLARFLNAEHEYALAQQNHEDIAAASERMKDEEKMVKEYSDYFVAFYERGYAIGSMQPEKYAHGEDFFTKIVEWRNLAISRNINNHIGKLN